MAAIKYEITDGPSKWDLMLALFDWQNERGNRTCSLTVVDALRKSRVVLVSIVSVKRDPTFYEGWFIEGIFLNSMHSFSGPYQTSTRKGVIMVEES